MAKSAVNKIYYEMMNILATFAVTAINKYKLM